MSEDCAPSQEVLIEIRGIYDGWSVKKLADGTLVNRWPTDDRRHAPTQEWIERMRDTYSEPTHPRAPVGE